MQHFMEVNFCFFKITMSVHRMTLYVTKSVRIHLEVTLAVVKMATDSMVKFVKVCCTLRVFKGPYPEGF